MKLVELHPVFYANCHLVTVKYTFRDSRRFITIKNGNFGQFICMHSGFFFLSKRRKRSV
jgi:hypothetical protein